jgi:serine/threonine-protein kinase
MLTVSRGRPVVPAVAPGVTVAAAEQIVRDAELTPVRSTAAAEFSETVPEGAVVRTDPAAGAALPIGGTVTLVLSKGAAPPPEVRVPQVTGERLDDARSALSDAGLDVQVEQRFPFGPRRNGVVVDQNPGSGESVEPGTTVTLSVF